MPKHVKMLTSKWHKKAENVFVHPLRFLEFIRFVENNCFFLRTMGKGNIRRCLLEGPQGIFTGPNWHMHNLTMYPHATLLQLYMWRHIDSQADWRCWNLRLVSKRHRHFGGFLNLTIKAPTRGHRFLRLFWEIVPFSCLVRLAGDVEDTFSS